MSDNFFDRKKTKEVELPTHGDYDPYNFDNDLEACGITDYEGFQARHNALFQNLMVDSNQQNPVATVAKKIESSFTKRELAFLMSKDLLQAAYNQSEEQFKQLNKNG